MTENYMAVIQAGGLGTRMVEITQNKIPKPMILLNGKPIIQWQIENLVSYGINEIIIVIGYLGWKMKEYFDNINISGVKLEYIEEEEPLGSGGALYYLKQLHYNKNFLLIYGDVIFDIEWNRMIAFHESHEGIATLLIHPNAHPYDSDMIILEEDKRISGIDSKNNQRNYWYQNLVNAGIYIFNKETLNEFSELKKRDLEKDILHPLILSGKVYGYRSPEYVKDVGIPERYRQACKEQKAGIWKKKNLRNHQRCIFLDRDGTINKYCNLISKEEDFELEENAAEAIKKINESGYLAIVITNQPVVARGLCEIKDVENIHCKMQVLLGEKGAYLDDIAFCPHHPDKGYPEENVIYKIECTCRKPLTGMINLMKEKYNIDILNSYMVGDSTVDIQTGKNAGLRTIMVTTGEAGKDEKYNVVADYIAGNIMEAVDIVLSQSTY